MSSREKTTIDRPGNRKAFWDRVQQLSRWAGTRRRYVPAATQTSEQAETERLAISDLIREAQLAAADSYGPTSPSSHLDKCSSCGELSGAISGCKCASTAGGGNHHAHPYAQIWG